MYPQRPRQEPHTRPLEEALQRHTTLGDLLRRARDSQAMLAVACQALPPAVRPYVAAGTVDDDGWTLLVRTTTLAGKLRHAVPLVQEALREAGWQVKAVRIRVMESSSPLPSTAIRRK